MSDKKETTMKEHFLKELLEEFGITYQQYKQLGEKVTKLIVDEHPNIMPYFLPKLVQEIRNDLDRINEWARKELNDEMERARVAKLPMLQREYILKTIDESADDIFSEK